MDKNVKPGSLILSYQVSCVLVELGDDRCVQSYNQSSYVQTCNHGYCHRRSEHRKNKFHSTSVVENFEFHSSSLFPFLLVDAYDT